MKKFGEFLPGEEARFHFEIRGCETLEKCIMRSATLQGLRLVWRKSRKWWQVDTIYQGTAYGKAANIEGFKADLQRTPRIGYGLV